MALPEVLTHRGFNLYWVGVVLSQVGTRGTVAANLYHVYDLSGSVVQTGLVGAAQAVALLVLSPIGGVYADRMDRRRLLQFAQAAALVVAAALAAATLAGAISAWHVMASVLLTTAAGTFDQPARQALIPSLVPRHQLPQAFALLNPSREVAVLAGPALAGVLIAVGGPGLMYAVDAGTYLVLIVVLGMLKVPALRTDGPPSRAWHSLVEGASFVRRQKLIWMLMSLDLSSTLFGAYRVLLPALCADVLLVGPAGYGVLSAVPSAGALLATYVIFRVIDRSRRLGRILLIATVAYGLATILLAQASWFALAVVAAALAGAADAMATSIRHAAVQLVTPDELRGRVSAFYQMGSRGGPALGDTFIGAVAGLVGPVIALTAGGAVAATCAFGFLLRPNTVRSYLGPEPEPAPDTGPGQSAVQPKT